MFNAMINAKKYLPIILVATYVVWVSADPEKVWAPLHLVFAHPGLVDQFGGVNSPVVLELEQGQLTGNLQRMVLQEKKMLIWR